LFLLKIGAPLPAQSKIYIPNAASPFPQQESSENRLNPLSGSFQQGIPRTLKSRHPGMICKYV
jgi:hypothetical protein